MLEVLLCYYAQLSLLQRNILTLYLTETRFKTFANRADPDQAALIRAALSGSTLFAYGNMMRYDPTIVNPTSLCSMLV